MRSVFAVIVGYLLVGVLTLGATFLYGLVVEGQPRATWVVVNFLYSVAFVVAGGYCAARLAPRSPLGHAIALGLLIFVIGVAYQMEALLSYPGAEGSLEPWWYLLALPMAGVPAAVLGGYLGSLRRRVS